EYYCWLHFTGVDVF
nr:immunoglobulin light chain junction region [Macaca mulatta]